MWLALAVLDRHRDAAINLREVQGGGQAKRGTGQRQAADSLRLIAVGSGSNDAFTAWRIHSSVDAIALLRIGAGRMDAFNLHEIEQPWAVGVFGHISRRP